MGSIQQDFRPTQPSFSNFEQNQEILETTEPDIGNLADNADNFVSETVEPAKTGSGGSESLDINVSMGGTGAETGSGGIENLITPPEPETAPTEPTVPPIAPSESVAEPPAPIAPLGTGAKI